MAKQALFLCIGGFLNGSAIKDQGESETTTDQQAKKWVLI